MTERNKNNNIHNFTKYVAGAGSPYGVSVRGEPEVTTLTVE